MSINIKPRKTDGHTVWEIIRNGQFVIGALDVEEIDRRLYRLIDANWKYLDCMGSTHADPTAFIEQIEANGHRLQMQFEHLQDGRSFMGGKVAETGTEFRYLILDRTLAMQLQQRIDATGLRQLPLAA